MDPENQGFDRSQTVAGGDDGSGSPALFGPGWVFGRYTILERLGAGGMGIVYAAYDSGLDRKVALKVLRPALRGSGSQQRLLREAQAMARLSHPNVVTVHDVGEIDGRAFISMEFVDGGSLAQWLEAEDRDRREILRIFLAAGQGLAAAHRAGLIHRDFKPANVLLGTDGRVRVADFGLARAAADGHLVDELFDAGQTVAADEQTPASGSGRPAPLAGPLTMPGTIVGTPRFMAPEQVLERQADAASDQFSFCLALFEAVFGEPAFGEGDMMQLARRALAGNMAPVPAGSGIPGRAKRAVVRGLSADPESRFPTMDALLTDLAHDPAIVRRRYQTVGLASLLSLVCLVAVTQFLGARRDRCAAGAKRVAEVWNEDRAGAVVSSFESTGRPYAGQTAAAVEEAMTARANGWARAYTEVCEAAHNRGEVSAGLLDRQMACLDQRLKEMDRLLGLLTEADGELVEGATDAIQNLPAIGPCKNRAELVNLQALPADESAVAAIDAERSHLAAAEALKAAGQFEKALEQVREVVTAARTIAYAPLLAAGLQLQGHLEIELGQGETAVTTLREGLIEAVRGGDERAAAVILNELVWADGVQLQRFEQADLWSRLAEARLGRVVDEGDLEAEILSSRASVYENEGRYDDALVLQKKAHRAILKAHGPDSLEAAYAENHLANALYSVASYDEALDHYKRAAALRERVLGPHHPLLATTLTSLGSTLSTLGRNREALEVLERALAIGEEVYGPDHPGLAVTLNNIAFAEEGVGELLKALATHDRALAITSAAYGEDHPQTAYAHLNRVSIFRKLERFDSGYEEAQTAARILRAAYGENHPLYAYAANAEGVMLILMGHPRRAIAPLERAVAIREGVTTDAVVLAQTRFSLAKALWASGEDRARARRLVATAREALAAEGDRGAEDLELLAAWVAREFGGETATES